MNSHYVVFISVPLKIAMAVLRDILVKVKPLSKCMDLSADDIMSLLKFIMSTTYFQFGGESVSTCPLHILNTFLMSDNPTIL